MARYYLVVTLVNLTLGVIVALVMTALGMPQPVLWGIIAALVNFVPYAGPVVGAALIAVASLISFDDPVSVLLPPIAYIVLTAVEGYFVTPTLVGRTLQLNPLMVLLSVVFWGWLWGVAGAFLAVPLMIMTLRALSIPRVLSGGPVGRLSDGVFPHGADHAADTS